MQTFSVLSEVITRLALHYWGKPNQLMSRGNELRFGSHGSKSVNLEKATWYDHEENVGGGVVDLVKHQEPDASVADRLAEFGLPQKSSTNRREEVWDYTNSKGEIVYQVVRIDAADGKTYRQRQIGPDGKVIWNMLGVEPIPYKLPEILQSSSVIFITEGEKCVDRLASLGFVATTNHGGAGKWWNSLTQYFEGRDVVILPDNDEAGRKHAYKVAECLHGTAQSIKIVSLPNLNHKGDVYDWLSQGGTKEALLQLASAADFYSSEIIIETPDTVEPIKSIEPVNLPIFGFNQLEEKAVSWLVDGLIPTKSFISLYGRPGSFKSFVALYIATMIGAGKTAFERTCLIGDVVYVICEGSAGFKSRVDALKQKYDLADANVYFIPAQINLRSTDQDRKKLVSTIRSKGINPVLIVVDTLARAFAGGNENASEDMGAFIRQVGFIQEELNTAVMIVHHSGKDEARGQRGHSSLLGAVDTELEVSRASNATIERFGQLTVTKQKDGDDGFQIGYKMEVVPLGVIGGKTSSLALIPTEVEITKSTSKKGGPTELQKLALKALERAIEQDGKVVNSPHIPPNIRCVEFKFWRSMFFAMHIGEQDAKRIAFKRCSQALQSNRTIGFWDDLAWISDTS